MEIEQVLINGVYYNILDKIDYQNTTYFYLQNDANDNLLIQKLNNKNLVNLDSDEEINTALLLYAENNIKDA
ncbi:MAG: hypothetical protein IJH18_01755 [Bacilli bacterium]|nr:hypothetical protein [Bacilli bacterium]MBQ3468770.1 hypothetical protein [Bacilli bacterium]